MYWTGQPPHSPAHSSSSPPFQCSTVTPSFYLESVLTTPFLSSLSPSLSHPSCFPLCASVLFLIAPFIKEYKYFFPVCCISGCLFFFFCQLSGGLSPFCSALFLATCLVLLYPQCFSLISHQHYSLPPQCRMQKRFLLGLPERVQSVEAIKCSHKALSKHF